MKTWSLLATYGTKAYPVIYQGGVRIPTMFKSMVVIAETEERAKELCRTEIEKWSETGGWGKAQDIVFARCDELPAEEVVFLG